MEKILIVEDDFIIARLICEHLQRWGYEAGYLHDFRDVAAEVRERAPQLVILDLLLPFFNGHHWCREIRTFSEVPILVLSSASDNMNQVMAMNMGADDFVAKPFDADVLTAKVQALLRRAYGFSAATAVTTLSVRGVVLSLADATLSFEGRRAELSRNEFRIMELLLERAGHIVSRETMMERLWESEHFIDDNTLTVNIARLRAKLDELGLCEFIQTKKGLGYLIEL